jgi:hypothetical protein
MGIYNKDKDLDKSKYKPTDSALLEQYIKNYMKDDPKSMSEEDKKALID